MASTNASTRARASRATSRGTARDGARQCGRAKGARRAGEKRLQNKKIERKTFQQSSLPLFVASNVRQLLLFGWRIRVAPCRDRRGAEAYGFFPTQCNNEFYSRPSPRISADSRVNSAIRTRPFSAMKAATRSISSRET